MVVITFSKKNPYNFCIKDATAAGESYASFLMRRNSRRAVATFGRATPDTGGITDSKDGTRIVFC